jgi:RNA polymerase sigma factor (sigma-70 family)
MQAPTLTAPPAEPTAEQRRALVEKWAGLPRAVVWKLLRQSDAVRRLLDRVGLDDLLSIGNLALCRSARRWRPERGAFSTLATIAIRHDVLNEVRRPCHRVRLVPLPADYREQLAVAGPDQAEPGRHERLHMALTRLRSADRELLAQWAGLDGSGGRRLVEMARDRGLSKSRIGQLLDRALANLGRELARAG